MKYLTLLLLFCASMAYGQGGNTYPTMGTEFWLGFGENYVVAADDRLDLFITSDVNTSGTISIPQQGYTQNFTVTANVTTTVNIPNAIAEHFGGGFVDDRGILIETQDTCAVYAINFDNATADATKVLPTISLGTDYVVNTIYPLNGYHSEFVIVATEDGTEVDIVVTAPVTSGQPVGVPFTIQLDRGESYQLQATGSGDLTGSTVVGTETSGPCRPFAVFSGTRCTNIPTGCFACDHTFDQNFPTFTWGTEYYIVPISFATNYTYRVMALYDNTTYTVDGGAPISLNAGEFDEYNTVVPPRCIQGSGPIAVTQYLEGVTCAGSGDPAQMALNSADQMINNITLSTVTSTLITQHGLNVVMETPYVNTLTLDGVPVSGAQFTPFPSCPGYSYAQITIAQGSHTLDSPNGFTAYVYGTGQAESYAYSAGSFSEEPIAIVDTVICASDTVTLVAPAGVFNPWWANQNNPTDTLGVGNTLVLPPPVPTGVYIVNGSSLLSGCETSYQFSVEYMPPVPGTITITASDDTVCLYESVQLEATVDPAGTYLYSWTPSLEFDDPTLPNPILTPSQTGWYVCNAQSLTGCVTYVDSVYIVVVGGDVLSIDAVTGNGTNIDTICPGDDSQLDVQMERIILNDNFDPLDMGNWANILGGTASTVCGAVNGNGLYFDGAGTREAETIGLDVSTGGTVQFMLKIADGVAPCDNADPGEDVVLEYSVGGPWTIINTYNEGAYPNFTLIAEPIPAGAQSANTQFRWRQLSNSGAGQDNWVLDNVIVATYNNSGFLYQWSPAAGLSNPNIANPIAQPSGNTVYEVMVIDTLAGCNYIDSVTILADPQWILDMPNDTVLCDVAGVQLDANPTGGTGHSYNWTPNNGTLSDPNIQNPIATPATSTTYYVSATSELGCTVIDSIDITVLGLNSVTASVDDNIICEGASAVLDATVANNPGQHNYTWSPAAGLNNSNIQSPTATPGDTIWYTVTAVDTVNGCILVDSVQINVIPIFPVTAMNDTAVCNTNGIQLSATDGASSGVTYNWQPAGSLNNNTLATPTITVDSSMTFYVTITDAQGCANIDSVSLSIIPPPTVSLGGGTTLCDGETTLLVAGTDTSLSYLWQDLSTNNTYLVQDSGWYYVLVTGLCGNDIDSVLIDYQSCECNFIIPNVFSPNADGVNDIFHVTHNPDACEVQRMVIYNRWGEEIFESTDPDPYWDGRKKDKYTVPASTYYYLITIDEVTYTGHVTVVR